MNICVCITGIETFAITYFLIMFLVNYIIRENLLLLLIGVVSNYAPVDLGPLDSAESSSKLHYLCLLCPNTNTDDLSYNQAVSRLASKCT